MVSPLRRLTFFSDAKKKISKKRLAPSVRPLAGARGSFAAVSIRGHCPPVCFATTYMQRVRLRRTALRATPRMNTSTQPSEGAGGSRSKAAGELTLGLMSGEERVGVRRLAFLWELASRGAASQRRRPDSRPMSLGCTCSPRIYVSAQSVPNTFFARLVAAAAGFWRMVSSCLPIISNRPFNACSVT